MMLDLKDVTSYYGKIPILRNINFSLEKGKSLCVLGRNGGGKTTLLKTIMGLTTQMTGSLCIEGQDFSDQPTHLRAQAGLGYVPQGRRILEKFTVRENIRLGTFARKDKSVKISGLCLELFPYLAQNLDQRAGALSGGQQQQLAIARALATDPKVLLLDEIMEGIQPNIVAEIEQALAVLNREMGITLILAEQHIGVAKKLSDNFLMLDAGRMVAEGSISRLSDDLVQTHLTI